MTDDQFREILWRALIMILKAYAKRYGFGDIVIVEKSCTIKT